MVPMVLPCPRHGVRPRAEYGCPANGAGSPSLLAECLGGGAVDKRGGSLESVEGAAVRAALPRQEYAGVGCPLCGILLAPVTGECEGVRYPAVECPNGWGGLRMIDAARKVVQAYDDAPGVTCPKCGTDVWECIAPHPDLDAAVRDLAEILQVLDEVTASWRAFPDRA